MLPENEYKILSYISSCGTASLEDLKKALPEIESLNLRIRELKKHPALIRPLMQSRWDGFEMLSVPTDTYELSEYGKKRLQDHETNKSIRKKELWLKNAWIPIIVSITTTVITHHILPLLSKILRLAICILSEKL